MSDPIQLSDNAGASADFDEYYSDATDYAKMSGSTAPVSPEPSNSNNAPESAAAKELRSQGGVTRLGLERSLAVGKTAGSVGTGLNDPLHPGDPNPPAGQGLEFSETKSASGLAYTAKKDEIYRFPDGKQWLVKDVREDKESGFRAITLKPVDESDKRVIVAFKGSNLNGKDWTTNVKQEAGFQTRQYDLAAKYAEEQKKEYSANNVILTGHSLGGGMASFASIQTKLPATALNSAPLNEKRLGGKPASDYTNITQYRVPRELATELDEINPFDARPGKGIEVRGKYSIYDPYSEIGNHQFRNAVPTIPEPVKVK